MIFLTPAPTPFGLVHAKVNKPSESRSTDAPLYFWSEDYNEKSSHVSFEDGEFTVASGLFPVELKPDAEVSQSYQIRPDMDLGPLNSSSYSSRFDYDAQKGVDSWNQGSDTEKIGFELFLDITV
jgi:hypothetical protein